MNGRTTTSKSRGVKPERQKPGRAGPRGLKPAARNTITETAPKPAAYHYRRRGSALVLAIMVLGVLFVTGIAFMATMSFEARVLDVEQQANRKEVVVDSVVSTVTSVIRDSFGAATTHVGAGGSLGETKQVSDPGDPTGAPLGAYAPSSSPWVELPQVHGLISQVEPEFFDDPFSSFRGLVFQRVTDFSLMRGEVTASSIYSNVRYIDVSVGNDKPAKAYMPRASASPPPAEEDRVPFVVDADGDGIVDSYLVDLTEGLGFSPSQLAELAKIVNDPDHPSGRVQLGLRIIPHGAMVNLAEGHPNLIANVLNDGSSRPWEQLSRPYSPLVEEGSLRRRFMLPPRDLPVTAIQGNLFKDAEPGIPDTGDFGDKLFPLLDVPKLREQQHQYWPFSVSDVGTLWWPKVNPDSRFYDRRHLVTSISYDDLLARPVRVDGKIKGVAGKHDVVDIMRDRNDGTFPDNRCNPEPVFVYPDYPVNVPNAGDDGTLCLCTTDQACDRRKGRLKLSLPQLDDAVDPDTGWMTNDQRVTLIQDVFTMLLLNARGSAWGSFDPGTGNWVWDATAGKGLDEVAVTAAALTANMLDFADADDKPSRVAIRSADPNSACFGKVPDPSDMSCPGNPEYVYGLERQLYITEIAATIKDDGTGGADAGPSSYAIELFNPYDSNIGTNNPDGADLDYHIRIVDSSGAQRIQFQIPTKTLNKSSPFLVIEQQGSCPIGDIGGLTTDVRGGFSFTEGDTIYLLLQWEDPDGGPTEFIVVDQFEVPTGKGFKPFDPTPDLCPPIKSLARMSVSVNTPWFAPIPADPADAVTAIVGAGVKHSLGSPDTTTPDPAVKPVQVLLANTGKVGDTGPLEASFPTTGSLLLLMRHGNRAVDGSADPAEMAFTTHLGGDVARTQIDNGRMPVFDVKRVHHQDPADTPVNAPGGVAMLPWGQLVFEYFTALPLSNPSPFANPTHDPDFRVAPDARPRVDEGGLRVHGRINLNAAPWTVMAGLPLMPMASFPAALKDAIKKGARISVADEVSEQVGPDLAKAIVAYRDMRKLPLASSSLTTGDYGDPTNGRSWSNPAPAARRGTGFLTIGELANVRHPSAMRVIEADSSTALPPYISFARIDGGIIENTTNPEEENYISAVALLVALNDWVTVRSHVFTVYGVLRGVAPPDPTLGEPIDLDARAIRFQETVDRLPTFFGAAKPVQIGQRYVGKYRDASND